MDQLKAISSRDTYGHRSGVDAVGLYTVTVITSLSDYPGLMLFKHLNSGVIAITTFELKIINNR